MQDNKTYTRFSESDIENFKPEMKVGLLATASKQGLPHLTLISTLQACSATGLFWGQFSEGISKNNIHENPHTGFLIMTLDRNLWRGKARFTHTSRTGAEFDLLNNTPMFRYNAYFGVHTVYYMDLVSQTGKQPLPMGGILQAAVKTMIARTLAGKGGEKEVINGFTRRLIDKMTNLKFLAYVDADGYPFIIPVIQAQTAGTDRIIFASSVYGDDLKSIAKGSTVALFGMSFEMQTVVLRGAYQGISSVGGVRCGSMEVDWVYNPMPPKPGQVYPLKKLEAITSF